MPSQGIDANAGVCSIPGLVSAAWIKTKRTHRSFTNVVTWLAIAAMALISTGCQHTRQAQIEGVAKDWCATIRGSQVIPVYPLTEDLQPGDLFLVETSVANQRLLYQGKGYLPFELGLGRLNPKSYIDFYNGGYGVSADKLPPRHWQFPDSRMWSNAPIAVFPSYDFSVKSGQGLRAAFPVSGVPVGLSLLNTHEASGSVAITGGHTYGLDEASLAAELSEWESKNRELLARHASDAGHPRFVRLVTRVYLAEEVNVSLRQSGSSSGGADAGITKAFALPEIPGTNAMEIYTNSLATLNAMLSGLTEASPGGSLRAVAVSKRSISLRQRFARPVVIGYLASEHQILPDGTLGQAYSTRELLEGRSTAKVIQGEQQEAARIVLQLCSFVSRASSPDALDALVESSRKAKVLAEREAQEVKDVARGDLTAARKRLKTLYFDFARGGTPQNTLQLLQLLLYVKKPGRN